MDKKEKNSIYLAIPILALLIILAIVVLVALNQKRDAEAAEEVSVDTEQTAVVEKWQEGTIYYDGQAYRYNNHLKNYLFLGIDSDEKVTPAKDGISGGQSDAMFLLIEDTEKETLSILAINRNTMTPIDVYDKDGNYVGQQVAQICLQHGYGNGQKLSCSRAADAVSRLLYNVPISGYMSVRMGAIPQMNDAVGGVEVEVLDDLSDPARGVELKQGETVTLSGEEAYVYLRRRDLDTFDSATQRLERQMQYLTGFFTQAMDLAKRDKSAAVDIYNSMSDYLVTNMDATGMLTETLQYSFDDSQVYTVPGETVMGETFEEYHVDEDALYQLILELFYEPVEE
ncbi:MAG: LCP family protein [Roseburia sp.]